MYVTCRIHALLLPTYHKYDCTKSAEMAHYNYWYAWWSQFPICSGWAPVGSLLVQSSASPLEAYFGVRYELCFPSCLSGIDRHLTVRHSTPGSWRSIVTDNRYSVLPMLLTTTKHGYHSKPLFALSTSKSIRSSGRVCRLEPYMCSNTHHIEYSTITWKLLLQLVVVVIRVRPWISPKVHLRSTWRVSERVGWTGSTTTDL